MKTIPTIQKYMTTSPHSIGKDQTLAKAEEMMRHHHIRHLPVLDGGKLLGIISDRDIKFLETFKDVNSKSALVGDAFIDEVFRVRPTAPLNDVCSEMAEKKLGCAIVTDNDKLVGIFTWVDALRAMSEVLETRFHK